MPVTAIRRNLSELNMPELSEEYVRRKQNARFLTTSPGARRLKLGKIEVREDLGKKRLRLPIGFAGGHFARIQVLLMRCQRLLFPNRANNPDNPERTGFVVGAVSLPVSFSASETRHFPKEVAFCTGFPSSKLRWSDS